MPLGPRPVQSRLLAPAATLGVTSPPVPDPPVPGPTPLTVHTWLQGVAAGARKPLALPHTCNIFEGPDNQRLGPEGKELGM